MQIDLSERQKANVSASSRRNCEPASNSMDSTQAALSNELGVKTASEAGMMICFALGPISRTFSCSAADIESSKLPCDRLFENFIETIPCPRFNDIDIERRRVGQIWLANRLFGHLEKETRLCELRLVAKCDPACSSTG
jgi:hypothetical protein